MKYMKHFFLILFGISSSFICLATSLEFNVIKGIKASITWVDNKKVEYEITGSDRVAKRGYYDVDTENNIHVKYGDYNFDGKEDFVIWYTDDGMGIYDIYRVFLYSEKVADFKEIKPSCGDDFINLNLNKKKRELISMYYSHNEAQRCITNVFVDENKLK